MAARVLPTAAGGVRRSKHTSGNGGQPLRHDKTNAVGDEGAIDKTLVGKQTRKWEGKRAMGRTVTHRGASGTSTGAQTIAMWVSVTMALVAVGGLIVSAIQLRQQVRYYRHVLGTSKDT